MHQSHAIPWNTAARHLDFIRETSTLPRRDVLQTPPSVLHARNDAHQAQDLNHFVRSMLSAIRTFSTTEKTKVELANGCHGKRLPLKSDPTVPLFSDSVMERAKPLLTHADPFYLNSELLAERKQMEAWDGDGIQRPDIDDYNAKYNTDVLKLLLQLGESEAVLRIAQEKKRYVRDYCHHCYEGISQLVYRTLRLYLVLNLGYAVRQRTMSDQEAAIAAGKPIDAVTGLPRGMSPRKCFASLYEIQQVKHAILLRDMGSSCCDANSSLFHSAFWHRDVCVSLTTRAYSPLGEYLGGKRTLVDGGAPDDLSITDPARMREYLAHSFRILYLVDMLICEQHDVHEVDDFWREHVTHSLAWAANIPRTKLSCQPYEDNDEAVHFI